MSTPTIFTTVVLNDVQKILKQLYDLYATYPLDHCDGHIG